MNEHLAEGPREGPRVILAQRVIDKMVRGALLYPEPETGEAMIGLIIPPAGGTEPDIYILDTISPGERAVREWGMFEQGDDWQADVFNWLHANWEAFRDIRRPSYGSALAAKWDTPLMHVGDWHKQPGDMTEPSGGDAQTARRMIDDVETPLEHIVAPIVTLYPLVSSLPASAPPDLPTGPAGPTPAGTATPSSSPAAKNHQGVPVESLSPNALKISLPDEGWIVRIDFWYMSKRSRRFVAITPVIWADEKLPGLPPISWHLAHPHRFDQEYSLLTGAGYTVDIVRWDADGKPPYEICFSVSKPDSRHVILLVTSVDYPARMPAVRTAPPVSAADGEDVFEKLYSASQPVPLTQMPDWPWDSKRALIELVWHMEKTLSGETAS